MAIDSDLNNPDARLYVEFYNRPLQNEFKSNAEGRPIFEDVTFIKIVVPGDNTFDIDTVALDHHKQRFPLHWQRFLNAHGEDPKQIGTPLSQWPLLTPAIAEELKYQKYTTVESIATASDAQINRLGMSGGMSPYTLRERARRYLEMASGEADLTGREEEIKKLREDQEAKDAKHAAEMQAMQEQIQALTAAFSEKSKPGRKPLDKAA
jgi:hypothetical protein